MSNFPSKASAVPVVQDNSICKLVANTPINQGDIVVSHALYGVSSLKYKAGTSTLNKMFRKNNVLLTSYNSLPYGSSVATLTNGNFVIGYSTDTDQYPYAKLFDRITGTEIANVDPGASSDTSNYTAVAGLVSGNFVIAWDYGASLKFARYNTTGTIVGSVVNMGSVTPHAISMVALATGDFVIAYLNGSNYPCFGRYNSSGTLQGSLTTVESVASTYISIATLVSGDFVITYRNNSPAYVRFARYNSTATLQGSLTTVESAASASCAVGALTTGDFIIGYSDASSYPKYARYNSSGVLQGSLTTVISKAISHDFFSVVGLPNGEFLLGFSVTSNKGYVAHYNSLYVLQDIICPAFGLANNLSMTILDNNWFVFVTCGNYYHANATPYHALTYSIISYTYTENVSAKMLGYSGKNLEQVFNVNVGTNIANCSGIDVAVLSNGNIAVVHMALSGQGWYSLYSPTGILLSTSSNSFTSSTLSMSVVALPGGGASVIASVTSLAPTIYLLPNNISVMSGSVYLNDYCSAAPYSAMAVMPCGDVICAFNREGCPAFIRLNSTLTRQFYASYVVSETSSSMAVACLLNSDYVIAYVKDTGAVAKFARYDKFNVLQGSVTTVAYGVGETNLSVTPLNTGGFVIATLGSPISLSIYNNLGVLQNTVCVDVNVPGTYFKIATLVSGEIVAVYNSNSSGCILVKVYSPTGTLLYGPVMVSDAVNTCYAGIAATDDGGFVIVYSITSTYPKLARFKPFKQVHLGVALNSASNNGLVSVAKSGIAGSPISFTGTNDFGVIPVEFDSTSNGGIKGVVMNKTVLIKDNTTSIINAVPKIRSI